MFYLILYAVIRIDDSISICHLVLVSVEIDVNYCRFEDHNWARRVT